MTTGPFGDDVHVGQLIHQLATAAGSTVLAEPEMLAAAVLGSADGTAIANSLDPSPHQAAAFAWTLATLLLAALDPPPVDEAGRADLFARLLSVAATA